MERRVYDNGLVAIAERIEGRKKASILTGIGVGSKNEPIEKKGGLHLLEHRLFGSNDIRTQRDYAKAAEYRGLEINAGTSLTQTVFFCNTPVDKLDLGIDLSFDAVTNRSYDMAEFYRERDEIIKTELITFERFPYMRFLEKIFFPRVFTGTPLSDDPIGTSKSLKNIEHSDIIRLMEENYVPNNTVVVGIGSFNEEYFFELVEKKFGTEADLWKSKPVQQPDFTWKLQSRPYEYKEFQDLKDPEDSSQDGAIVYLAYQVNPGSHPDEAGLWLLENILGEGLTAFIFQDLREESGIGYNVNAKYISIEGNGLFYFGVPMLMPYQINEAVDRIQDAVQGICTKLLPEEDFEGNKVQTLSNFDDILDSTRTRSSYRVDRELDKCYYDLTDLPKAINKITQWELLDIAKRNLSGDPLIVIASAPGYQNRYSHLATK